MNFSKGMLSEFDHEMENTRKTLARIPADKLDYKPHPKSMALGSLAMHLAAIPGWAVETLTQKELDLAPPGKPPYKVPAPESVEHVLSTFDKARTAGRAAIEAAKDEIMLEPWSLLSGGHAIFTLPRIAVMRGFVMNHVIHHRAQLGVYLRLNDVPVPAIYGPSADEQG